MNQKQYEKFTNEMTKLNEVIADSRMGISHRFKVVAIQHQLGKILKEVKPSEIRLQTDKTILEITVNNPITIKINEPDNN